MPGRLNSAGRPSMVGDRAAICAVQSVARRASKSVAMSRVAKCTSQTVKPNATQILRFHLERDAKTGAHKSPTY